MLSPLKYDSSSAILHGVSAIGGLEARFKAGVDEGIVRKGLLASRTHLRMQLSDLDLRKPTLFFPGDDLFLLGDRAIGALSRFRTSSLVVTALLYAIRQPSIMLGR